MTFRSVGNVIIPTDKLIFLRGVGIPPTSFAFSLLFARSWVLFNLYIVGILVSLDGFLWQNWALNLLLKNSIEIPLKSHRGMDQYLLIPFLVGWTSINPSYFDVNWRGTRFWHTAIEIAGDATFSVPGSWIPSEFSRHEPMQRFGGGSEGWYKNMGRGQNLLIIPYFGGMNVHLPPVSTCFNVHQGTWVLISSHIGRWLVFVCFFPGGWRQNSCSNSSEHFDGRPDGRPDFKTYNRILLVKSSSISPSIAPYIRINIHVVWLIWYPYSSISLSGVRFCRRPIGMGSSHQRHHDVVKHGYHVRETI